MDTDSQNRTLLYKSYTAANLKCNHSCKLSYLFLFNEKAAELWPLGAKKMVKSYPGRTTKLILKGVINRGTHFRDLLLQTKENPYYLNFRKVKSTYQYIL